MSNSSASPLANRKSRRRRSPAEILGILQDYRSSGLTQAAFAASQELPLSTLTNWLRRDRANGDADDPNPTSEGHGFVEAQVFAHSTTGGCSCEAEFSHDVELMLGNQAGGGSCDYGRTMVKSVRLRGGFDSGDLGRVLDALGIGLALGLGAPSALEVDACADQRKAIS